MVEYQRNLLKVDYRINNFYCRVLNRLNYFKNRTVVIYRKFYGKNWRIPIIDELGYEYSYGNNTEIWLYTLLKKINSNYEI